MADPVARTLNLLVNGERRALPAPLTLAELLVRLSLQPTQVAVERNKKLVRRADFGATALADGDQLEVVTFFGGG